MRTPTGRRSSEAHAVVSAVGQLNRPHYPEIPGVGSFAGPAFHSARWDASVDLAGKRVAVIGTGASAMQLIPEIAPEVGELLVFQRTPAWMVPTPDYHDQVPEGLTRALQPRARLQRVQPVLHLLAHGRRRPGGCHRRPRLGPARLGRTHERDDAADADRVHQGRVRRPTRPDRGRRPHLPGGRQGDPRQRSVGARSSATTCSSSRPPSARSRPPASSPSTAWRTTSTCSSTAPGSPPRSSWCPCG